MSALLSHGADVHAVDEDGWQPLHVAAYWGNEDALQQVSGGHTSGIRFDRFLFGFVRFSCRRYFNV